MCTKNTKYYKIELETDIEGVDKHPVLYTTSNYYSDVQIKTQVINAIDHLRLPAFARVSVISVSEITAAESSALSPIQSFYKPLKKAANDMKWRMEAEELERDGVKNIRLGLFFKRLEEYLSGDGYYEEC